MMTPVFVWTIAPAEGTALNELGLSTQVPAKYTFISDGPTKKFTLENGIDIRFKHKTNKEISKLTTKEAVKYLIRARNSASFGAGKIYALLDL